MKRKKYLTGFITGALSVSILLSGCKDKEASTETDKENKDNLNNTNMPIVKEKIELDGFAARYLSPQNWEDLMLWKEYEKMTNIHINWETVSTEALPEKRNLMLASGDYPDLLFAAALPKSDLIKYGQQGVFLPLNDLIDKYAPNLKKIMDENPVVKQGITMADGNIYGFPAYYDPNFKGLRMGTPWIQKDWLNKLGLEEPTTWDELYEVLKKFKEEDPNGNGQADEIPLGASYSINQIIDFLKGSVGLNNHGASNGHIDLDPKGDKLRFQPTSKEYEQLLTYLNKLYTEGLIDKEVFTPDSTKFNAAAAKGIYGVLPEIDPKAWLSLDGYVGMPVIEGPDGDRINTAVGSPLGNVGMFVITDKNKNPEATVRWIDHFYGEEGIKMFFMGFEGVTYTEKNGEFVYTDEMTKNPDGLNLDQALSKYLTWPGGYYPGVVMEKYFQGAEGSEESLANAEKAEPLTLKEDEIWPNFNYTVDESSELSALSTDINTYVTEMTANFITGKKSLDEWDNYVKTLEKMGLERFMEINEAAYKRYKEQ
ncbi:ABC transporter substrate-binding protein [Sporosarcina globispora]|uniref:ABC transporter substrate-binding protein n=1 Tax=Sporosarcina globispora TaxID=1459 RepID=A0A0M0GJN3_SPOGL|nr:extracellular solute-binding protein [Sporosarcina globispora]KON90059.1 ABC transporter substrate-binding protein [Sporosarcina globispora]